jgi:hypothetical protein
MRTFAARTDVTDLFGSGCFETLGNSPERLQFHVFRCLRHIVQNVKHRTSDLLIFCEQVQEQLRLLLHPAAGS